MGSVFLIEPVTGDMPLMAWRVAVVKGLSGATNGNWTRDLILTMDALYHLSYRGMGLIILYAL